MYVSTPTRSRRSRRGLGRLGENISVDFNNAIALRQMELNPSGATPSIPACSSMSWWQRWLSGNALVCSEASNNAQNAQDQMQSVVTNAIAANAAATAAGRPAPYDIAAVQAAVAQQIAQATSDVAAISGSVVDSQTQQNLLTGSANTFFNPSAAGLSLSTLTNSSNLLLYGGIGIAALLVYLAVRR